MSATQPSQQLRDCATLLTAALDGRCVIRATQFPRVGDVWLLARDVKGWAVRHRADDLPSLPNGFGSPMLRRAAAAGLIAARELGDRHDVWRFSTLDLAADWDAERALTDEQRAERTANAVRDLYADRRAQYGDTVALWPVSGNLAAVPQDGIKHAVEQGLLVRHDPRGRLWTHSGLVPADQHDAFAQALADAFAQALADAEQREHRARATHSDLVDQVHAAVGGDRYTVDHLTIPQLRAIVALLPTAQEGPTP